MLQWSRYNLLFKSKRNGWLLYNSASNSFLKPDDNAVNIIKEIKKNPAEYTDFSEMPDMFFKLRSGGFLVEEGMDDKFFRILKMRRLTSNYSGSTMTLTIAPTRNCNFACGYCFEENRTISKMSDKTKNDIIGFINKHKTVNKIHILWYGGEPLLEFKEIIDLTNKIKETGKSFSASLITNGYFLDKKVIAMLNELKIALIQITLDGTKETHDKRRTLVNGEGTFDKIVENIDCLLASNWQGALNIRVNIDGNNSGDFAKIYRFIEKKYPDSFGKKLTVYPGFVHGDTNPDINCYFNSEDKGRFLAHLAKEYNINPLPVFPHMVIGGCTLTKRNSYVIGPNGELYKCWNDVGKEEEVVGSVDDFKNWNVSLIAEGMIQASYLDNEKCTKCFFFPICDGGCPKMRLLNERKQGNYDTCSYFKKYIKELLEIHYEQKIKREKSGSR